MAAEAEPKKTAGDDLLNLPPEIWGEILNRLPARSILQCRAVCKSWYSLISCPIFISYYSLRNINKNVNRVLLQLRINGVCSFRSHDESFSESREHDDVPEPGYGSIVGSCNGLICLSKSDDTVVTFLIWNPTIRKVVELPSRTFNPRAPWFSYFGFGFDSKTNDYKVLCMCINSADLSQMNGGFANVCDIYDSRKGVWRSISPLVHPWNVERPNSECYLNGAVHWTGYRHGKSSDRILLSFSMSDEIFREIRLPDCVEFTGDGGYGDRYIQTRSVTFGGLIHVIVWNTERLVSVLQDSSVWVWVMKEYGVTESCTKLFNIHLPSGQGCPMSFPTTFCLWKNDGVLMVHDYHILEDLDVHEGSEYGQDLALYNTGSKTCTRLFSFDKCITNICLYEEGSLFLM